MGAFEAAKNFVTRPFVRIANALEREREEQRQFAGEPRVAMPVASSIWFHDKIVGQSFFQGHLVHDAQVMARRLAEAKIEEFDAGQRRIEVGGLIYEAVDQIVASVGDRLPGRKGTLVTLGPNPHAIADSYGTDYNSWHRAKDVVLTPLTRAEVSSLIQEAKQKVEDQQQLSSNRPATTRENYTGPITVAFG